MSSPDVRRNFVDQFCHAVQSTVMIPQHPPAHGWQLGYWNERVLDEMLDRLLNDRET